MYSHYFISSTKIWNSLSKEPNFANLKQLKLLLRNDNDYIKVPKYYYCGKQTGPVLNTSHDYFSLCTLLPKYIMIYVPTRSTA